MKLKSIIFLGIACLLISCNQVQETGDTIRCDRSCLEKFINEYIDAVIAHDPAKVKLAENVRFTENGQHLNPGDGLWNTASGWGTYKLYIADPEADQVAFIGTIRENEVPAIMALRLKIVNMEISEIETFVVRSDSGALKLEKTGQSNPVFLESIPEEERVSRDSLMMTANMYFTALERNDGKGVYPFTDDCNRLENGKPTTNNPAGGGGPFDFEGMGCKEQFETGFYNFVTRIRDRRFVTTDEERGLVFSFAFFDHAGNVPEVTLTNGITIPIGVKRPWTWEIAELFKIENGLIRQIEALYQEAPYGMGSGWSRWDQLISSEPIYYHE